nr:hypothetical protein [Tanacetum cinerariifolium]
MNPSTTVWEVETNFTSPIRPVFARDAGSTCVNKPIQVEKVNVTVSNDRESGISSTLNTSPNVNVSATDFKKDTTAKVQPASNKVHNSFASALKHKVNRVAEIVELRNEECVEGAAVTLPLAAIEEHKVNRVAEIVELRNEECVEGAAVTLPLAAIEEDGMNRVLDYGSWLVRRVPLILNIWSPNCDLHKAEINKVPVWVKFHNVPIVAYSEVGLSLITTQIGKPIQLDAYMIGKDKGHSLATIRIEYEWKPPRCSTCLIFDHTNAKCPKLPKEVIPTVVSNVDASHSMDVADDGFEVVKKKRNRKNKYKNRWMGWF